MDSVLSVQQQHTSCAFFFDRISVNQTSLIVNNSRFWSNISMALELFDMGTLLDLCNYSNSSIEIPFVNFTFPNAAVLETDGGAFPVVNQELLQFWCHQKIKIKFLNFVHGFLAAAPIIVICIRNTTNCWRHYSCTWIHPGICSSNPVKP